MIELLLLFLLAGYSSGYRFYDNYLSTECGDVYVAAEGIELPSQRDNCDIKVLVPEGSTFIFTLVGAFALMECKRIVIVDDITQETTPLCSSLTFFGTNREYTIKAKNLRQPVKAHIGFEPTELRCGMVVNRERIEYPLIWMKDREETCVLLVRSSDVVSVRRSSVPGPGEECNIHLEVSQGRHYKKMLKSTGNICLGTTPVETEISCGLAVLYFDGPIGSSLTITSRPSTKDSLHRLVDCPPEDDK